jgi:tetratricopeptide (TPR) repeat protein
MLIVCYVGLLLPALGFVNIYFMLYSLVSDHWQYAAMIVPCAVFAGGAATLCRRREASEAGWAEGTVLRTVPSAHPTATHAPKSPRIVQGCLGLALLAALAVLTWRQGRMYTDIETLYRTTIERNPACWMAHNNLGEVLADSGRVDEAIAHYRTALEIKPDYVDAHNNLGMVLVGRGQAGEAMAHFRRALEIKPDYASAEYSLGNALAGCGEVDEAIAHYRKALEIQPDYAEAHSNLGVALAGRGEVEEGMAHFRKALEIKPDYADAHNNLGLVLVGRGQADEAIAHFQKAVELKPDFAKAHVNLGDALAGRGQVDEAIPHYRQALDLARRQNKQALAESIQAQIRLYDARRPFHESPRSPAATSIQP